MGTYEAAMLAMLLAKEFIGKDKVTEEELTTKIIEFSKNIERIMAVARAEMEKYGN
jgi:hypothetical protein